MRWIAIGLLMFLVACATSESVHLRNASTGETVQCGPYTVYGNLNAAAVSAQSRVRSCISDYQRQGFERVQAP
jgi:hypothetical protein